MNEYFFKLIKTLTAIFLLGTISCSGSFSLEPEPGKSQKEELSIVNWNVQTFFDSITDGCEYEEFISSKKWGAKPYAERLSRLASAIKSIDADVLVMEEIENENVVHDISNFLAGEWNMKKIYRYACFAKDDGGSIGCAVMSRYPLENMSVHSTEVRNGKTMPKMRPVIQVTVCKGNKKLCLLINHWKSMSGGEQETEQWRLLQETVLAGRMESIANGGLAVLACGDFNRDIMKFKEGEKSGCVLLRNKAHEDCISGAEVISPWFDGKNLVEPGSYFYSDEWSHIDNFFAYGDIEITDFHPVTDGPWCDCETHVPEKYQIWKGTGYSDHLPIFCRVRF
ncbi:MAG: endonuclease/exonuclease/phosphatase family protein [Treponema sp.]|nr:endonuclease/exonuclease/phosphatase family protein [Treponema sp.]